MPVVTNAHPELHWRSHVIWRGKPERNEQTAIRAAAAMIPRFKPCTDEDGRAAVKVVADDDSELGPFTLTLPQGSWLPYKNAYQCAAQVIAEMAPDAVEGHRWIGRVVVSGQVVWTARIDCRTEAAALQEAQRILFEHCHVVAEPNRDKSIWKPAIHNGSAVTYLTVLTDEDGDEAAYATQREAWLHAVEALANSSAEALQKHEQPIVNTETTA